MKAQKCKWAMPGGQGHYNMRTVKAHDNKQICAAWSEAFLFVATTTEPYESKWLKMYRNALNICGIVISLL